MRAFVRPLVPHLAWEGVLLLVLLLVVVAGKVAEPRLFENPSYWVQWAIIGLLTSAVALSLRMATPNLAVPVFAALGAHWYVERSAGVTSALAAAAIAAVLCLLLGLALGAFVAVTGAPAWAASLGAFALLQAYLAAQGRRRTPLSSGLENDFVWFLLFALASVFGALVLASPDLRATLVSGPGGVSSRVVVSLVGLGGSAAVAGLAGALLASRIQSGVAAVPFDLFLLALGAALVAGISVYGGQGPVFGVVLASGIAAIIYVWNGVAGRASWSQLVLAGVLILVGLLVSRMISLLTRWFPA